MRFFNFFLVYMVQKYQNEIAPIFYYGKSPKTDEKDLKIPNIWSSDWGQPYWDTVQSEVDIGFQLLLWLVPLSQLVSHNLIVKSLQHICD